MTMHDHDIEGLISGAGPRAVPSADRSRRVREAVRTVWRGEVSRRRRRRIWLGGSLAVCAAMLIVVMWTAKHHAPPAAPAAPVSSVAAVSTVNGSVLRSSPNPTGSSVSPGEELAAGVVLETMPAATATVLFLGGGEMRLNSETVVRIQGKRAITLDRGTIYMDVDETRSGEFTVTTPLGALHDTGTRFEVRLFQDSLRLRVRDGTVLFERAGHVEQTGAGAELGVGADGALQRRRTQPFGNDWDWITRAAPVFRIENLPLRTFLEWAEREGGWRLDVPAAILERARSTRLHGDIAGLSPAEALEVVLPTCGLSATFSDGRVVIRQAATGGPQ
jgi:ferric-dicitrate binding protein FerR (iron transport regulator)